MSGSPKRPYSTWSKLHKLGNSTNELDVTYAEIIATAMDVRVRKGLTQHELAKRSGLSPTAISNIETQQSVPSLKNFLKYMQGLNLDWKFVYSKKDD